MKANSWEKNTTLNKKGKVSGRAEQEKGEEVRRSGKRE